eukprot:gnl/Trimastix_PCT/4910.p1 GENE.gnl/Trimastix_PCT/4910~~gnl/Trimastix_PCT/4910.p1  ORF type:complete len:119 (+),score=15.08 gnl/Trimastix_PCT/4910:24-380(+)
MMRTNAQVIEKKKSSFLKCILCLFFGYCFRRLHIDQQLYLFILEILNVNNPAILVIGIAIPCLIFFFIILIPMSRLASECAESEGELPPSCVTSARTNLQRRGSNVIQTQFSPIRTLD